MMRFLSFTVGYVCLCGACSPVFFLGLPVRLSWYPMWWGAVVVVTVMYVLFFCLACVYAARMLGVRAMLVWGPGKVWVAVSAYIGGTRGSGVLSIAGDVLEMGVVRGVGGVCDMCMCFAWGGLGGEGGEWMR